MCRTVVSCPSGPVEVDTSKSKPLLSTLAPTPPETSFLWRCDTFFLFFYYKTLPGPSAFPSSFLPSGVRWLHRPAQQHRHRLRALVVREAHQHDLLPKDQGAVSVETQRPGDAAQQVLHQKGQALCMLGAFIWRMYSKCWHFCVAVSWTLLLCEGQHGKSRSEATKH